ncbi:MAG: glycosyltransferase [Lachnospiraceae bacterium]|nr:glycosyltransferase [Lachnospiraceae bacterium]
MISVIVPVYNIQKEYLTRCIDSILAQTHKDFELLLVDDGSSDGSAGICDEYAKKDPRVRAFHKENGGSSSARNLGIINAKGDYISFIDSDDYIEKDMLEVLYNAVTEFGVKCAQVGRNEIDEAGNILPDICIPPKDKEIITDRDFLKELLMHRGDCSFCTKLIARDVFGATGDGYEFFPKGVLNEDFHILIKKLRTIGDIVSLPGYKYHVFYRVGSNSRKETKEEFSRVFKDSVDNADMAAQIVRNDYPGDEELKKIAFRFGIFQRLEYMLHIPVSQMKKGSECYEYYRSVVSYLRKNYFKALGNKYLSGKNKLYMTLFVTFPAAVRKLHKKIKRL